VERKRTNGRKRELKGKQIARGGEGIY